MLVAVSAVLGLDPDSRYSPSWPPTMTTPAPDCASHSTVMSAPVSDSNWPATAELGSAVASFASGGYTGSGGQSDVAGLVHRGEFVMPADATSRIGVPALDGLACGTGGAGAGVTVVVSYSDSQMKRVLDSAMARGDIIQHVKEHRNAIGVRS